MLPSSRLKRICGQTCREQGIIWLFLYVFYNLSIALSETANELNVERLASLIGEPLIVVKSLSRKDSLSSLYLPWFCCLGCVFVLVYLNTSYITKMFVINIVYFESRNHGTLMGYNACIYILLPEPTLL